MGISVAEFARRSGVSDTAVFAAIRRGRLTKLPDGSMDPELVNSWSRRAKPDPQQELEARNGETPEQAAERIVVDQGHAPHTLAEAERIKENYLAKLRQLEYDLKSGAVIRREDALAVVVNEYAIVRGRLRNIGAEVAPLVAVLNTAPECQVAYDKALDEALKELTLDRHDAASFGRAVSSRA